MEENITLVFHGFLNLNGKEKLKLVEAINEYFDSNEREPIRAQHEAKFEQLKLNEKEKMCPCCGR